MATLDDDYGYIDPSTVSPWSTAMRYGGIASVIMIVLGLLMYLTGMTDYEAAGRGEGGGANMLANVINWAVWIGGIVMAMKFHRDSELGGFLSFGRGFYTGFLTSVVMGVVGAIWTYVFFSFVAPETLEIMTEAAYDNMPEEQVEAAEGVMEMFMSAGFFSTMMLVMALIGGSIISLIASAILKKEHPAA